MVYVCVLTQASVSLHAHMMMCVCYCRLWQDGVLSRHLASLRSSSSSEEGQGPPLSPATPFCLQLFVLEGGVSAEQMDALASSCQDDILTLSNGHIIPLNPSTAFIFEVFIHYSICTPYLKYLCSWQYIYS